jgi:hypothetical protein
MDEEESYKKAKKRVDELRGFYEHLITYVVVNIMLVIINLVTSSDTLWFYWVTIFWGIGVICHAISVYGKPGKNWEEKKIKEIMEKERKRKVCSALNLKRRKIFSIKINCETASAQHSSTKKRRESFYPLKFYITSYSPLIWAEAAQDKMPSPRCQRSLRL